MRRGGEASVCYVTLSMIERMFIVATSALLPPTPFDSRRRNNNRNSFSSSFSLSTFFIDYQSRAFFSVSSALFFVFFIFSPQSHDEENFDLPPTKLFILHFMSFD
jgi:hypothetical protein